MAANTSTVTRSQRIRPSAHALVTVWRHTGAGIAAGWNRFASSGQLGAVREREVGRHTGARI